MFIINMFKLLIINNFLYYRLLKLGGIIFYTMYLNV